MRGTAAGLKLIISYDDRPRQQTTLGHCLALPSQEGRAANLMCNQPRAVAVEIDGEVAGQPPGLPRPATAEASVSGGTHGAPMQAVADNIPPLRNCLVNGRLVAGRR